MNGKIIRRGLKGGFTWLALTMSTGIIGSAGWEGIRLAWPMLPNTISLNMVFPVWAGAMVIAGLLLLLLIPVALLWFTNNVRNAELEGMKDFVELDESVLGLLSKLPIGSDREQRARDLMAEFLAECTRVLAGQVTRASVLRPSPDMKALHVWASFQMSSASAGRTFNIDPTAGADIKRGCAGETFMEGALRVINFEQKGDKWLPTNDCYLNFDPRRHEPPYRSLASVAIPGKATEVGGVKTTETLGVICFDCPHAYRFDREDIHELLRGFARRAGYIIQAYESGRA